jgi:aminopeptidase N
MLHCLRCTINNDSLFFSILKEFNLNNRYKTVTTDDFINFVNKKTGADYTAFFKKYLYDTEIPVLQYSFAKDGDDLILKYRWSGVGEGFVMPFGIETNDKKSFRLEANTSWQEYRIPQTSWFNFYNIWSGYNGCPDNAFTYYHTSWSRE